MTIIKKNNMMQKNTTRTTTTTAPPQRRSHNTNNTKRLYLMSDAGFLRTYILSLVILTLMGYALWTIPWSRAAGIDLYYWSTASMTTVAHRYAWWSIVGLLSSSCCAVQVLFNLLSWGCAGFNTILGPIRPMTVASTTLLQLISWSVAHERPYPSTTPTHAISTLLVVTLTFLPEFLFWYQARRSTTTTTSPGLVKNNSKESATTPPTTTPTTTPITTTTTTTLEYRLENVGCAACLTTISNIVQHLACVDEFTISLEQLSVTTTIPTKKNDHNNSNMTTTNRNNKNDENATTNDHAALIRAKLEEAGFPVQLLT